MRLTRRRFVRSAALGLGTLWLPAGCSCGSGSTPAAAPSSPIPATSGSPRVIVVGAGVAGLAAASELSRRGASVVVLEARDRIGGRVWTDHGWGFPIERGANWIHDSGGDNPITPIARRIGSRTVIDEDTYRAFDGDGRALTEAQSDEVDALQERIEDGLEELEGSLDEELATEAAVRRVAGDDLDALEQRALDFTMGEMEADVAGPLDEVALVHGDPSDLGYEGDDLIVVDGYDRIVDAVAEGVDTRLSCAVRAIEVGDRSVSVTTDSGREQADAVVVALPLGVLRAGGVRFVPALPAEKQGVIDRLAMGTLDKVILRFDHAFWPEGVQTFHHLSRDAFPYILDFQSVAAQPVLVLFDGGHHSVEGESHDDAERVAAGMDVVRACFGSSAPDPAASIVSRWAHDPLSLGSYSYVPVGARFEDRAALAAPALERLFFCGEATSSIAPATVAGAYESGLRAAAEVAGALELPA